MKPILFIAVAAMLAASVNASAATGVTPEFSPFIPKVITKVKALEALPAAQSYSADGVLNLRVARATVDCSVSADCTVGAHSLDASLPAKSLIKQSYYYSAVQPVSAGGGTLAVSCEDANNILSAVNVTGKTVGTISAGVQTGAAAQMSGGIAAACDIVATIASSDYTAGKLNFYIEYVTTD